MKNDSWNGREYLLDDQGELAIGVRFVPCTREIGTGLYRWREWGMGAVLVVTPAWLAAYNRQWELEGPHP